MTCVSGMSDIIIQVLSKALFLEMHFTLHQGEIAVLYTQGERDLSKFLVSIKLVDKLSLVLLLCIQSISLPVHITCLNLILCPLSPLQFTHSSKPLSFTTACKTSFT